MKLLKGYEDEKEIDTEEMMHLIDDVWHKHITNYNGCTVSHDITRNFIRVIISEINKDIQLRRDELDKFDAREKAESIEIAQRIECGQVVANLNTWMNRIKYKYAGYVLDTDKGSILYNFQP